MRTYRGYVVTLAGTFALVALLALASHSRVESQGQRPDTPVVVNNAADAPIPVTGTVDIGDVEGTIQAEQSGAWSVDVDSLPAVQQGGAWNVGITGTPSVQAQQSGGWNVGISGTPTVNLGAGNSVNIGNAPANPVPVQVMNGGGGIPVTLHRALDLSDGQAGEVFAFPGVPADKILIIQYVSVGGEVPAGQAVRFKLNSGGFGEHNAMHDFGAMRSAGAQDFWGGNHQTLIYHPGGSAPIIHQHRFPADGNAVLRMTLSGILVDM